MISIPGIKSILKCDKGSLASTPTNPIYVGLRDKAKMTFPPFKTSKEYKGRSTRNKLQAMLEYESMQPTLLMLKGNFDHMNINCDVQVVSDKQAFTADSEDVFKFNSSSFLLGLGFEYMVSLERRSLKETLKGAADYDIVKALIDSGDSEALVAVAGITHPGGEDWALQRRINIMALESPIATALYSPEELEDFKFSIKAVETENADGQTTIDGFDCSLDVTIKNASVTKVVAQLTKALGSNLLLKFANSGSYYDAFDFNTGVLAQIDEPEISDDKRNMSIKYFGQVRPYEFDFQFGADKGGALSDNGLNGGTVKVGY